MAQKNFCGPKVKVKVKVSSPGRPLRILHLLLQFSTDLDNSFCILFTIGWTTFLLLRILNFDLRPKWHRLKVGIQKTSVFKIFFKIKWPPCESIRCPTYTSTTKHVFTVLRLKLLSLTFHQEGCPTKSV